MAKRQISEARKKQLRAQRAPYTPTELLLLESCACDPRYFPSQKTLDAAAELAMTGGFNVRRKNICLVCYLARSVNGTCGCP